MSAAANTPADAGRKDRFKMFLNCVVQPEISVSDLFAPVRAGVRRAPVVVVDADGRLRVVLEAGDDDDLADDVRPLQIGVMA